MPIVYHKKNKHLVRYPQWMRKLMLSTAEEYRRGRYTDWKLARWSGALDKLPAELSNRAISKYVTNVKRSEKPGAKEKKREANRKYIKKSKYKSGFKRKLDLFRDIPEDLKKDLGWRPRRVWDPNQTLILKILVKLHRKSQKTIDWVALMDDPLAKYLPNLGLRKLRSAYWGMTTRYRPDVLKKRRAASLTYKKSHMKRFKKNHRKYLDLVRDATNEYLSSRTDKKYAK